MKRMDGDEPIIIQTQTNLIRFTHLTPSVLTSLKTSWLNAEMKTQRLTA